ncbi:hypothetical protein H4582DRAFT_1907583 [Lactarius indigo]|nr:hypothetical protein H4582DRAFT_1907583 [Lactarius indigo]
MSFRNCLARQTPGCPCLLLLPFLPIPITVLGWLRLTTVSTHGGSIPGSPSFLPGLRAWSQPNARGRAGHVSIQR